MIASGGYAKVTMMSSRCGSGELIINLYVIIIDINRTSSSIRTILPAMHYLNQSLVTILQELKAVNYSLGPVGKCVSCDEKHLLEYITYNIDHQSSTADHLKCPRCAHSEAISIITTAVISKVISVMSSIVMSSLVRLTRQPLNHSVKK